MNRATVKELLTTVIFQLTKNLVQPQAKTNSILILFINTPWGQHLNFEGLDLPPNVELTTNKWRFREATAVVFHIPTFNWLYRVKKQAGQLWVAWSMECDKNYPQLNDPEFMQHFDLTMTYQLNSDVQTSYFSHYGADNLDQILKTPPEKKNEGNLASLFISSRFDQSGRLEYAAELMKHVQVHSYGKQLTNRGLKNDCGRKTKWDLMANYKFNIAFENSIAPDYVTEKFYDSLIVGSVPVYMGAPNIDALSPADHCFINVADYSGPKELAEYLLVLDQDEARYQEYMAWKKKPLRAEFLKLVDEQRDHPFVRLYRKILKQIG